MRRFSNFTSSPCAASARRTPPAGGGGEPETIPSVSVEPTRADEHTDVLAFPSLPHFFSLTFHACYPVDMSCALPVLAFVVSVANPFGHLLSVERNRACFRLPCLESGL